MEKLWENFTEIKEKITQYAEAARKNEWIEKDEYNNIVARIQNNVLTLGVIGQMKSGKSTFLNAFLFKDTVLPVAATAMTAALSVITYGEKEEVIAEFYSVEEWEEIEQKALSDSDQPDVKAAKELKEKSAVLGGEIKQLLGKTKSADISDLINYVGAKGKYTPITKQVTIYKSDKRLKGVRIVDTPGFNDPVVSREERTKKFLREADAVILLLHAGRPFDSEDRDILFEQVKNVGVGKIIIGVNKYDRELEDGAMKEDIIGYVRDKIKEEVDKEGNKFLKRLLNDIEPVLLSAHMALFAVMPKEKIKNDKSLCEPYENICKKLEINSPDKFYELSGMENLEHKIDAVLSEEKMGILVRKPLNEIQARINAKKKKYEEEDILLTEKKKNLSRSDDELDEKLRMNNRAKRKTERVIDGKEIDINEFLSNNFSDTIFDLKKEVKKHIDDYHNIIDNTKNILFRKRIDEIVKKINSKIEDVKISIEETYTGLYKVIKSKLREITNETLLDMEEILSDVSDDEDWIGKKEDLLNKFRKELQKFNDISFVDMFTGNNNNNNGEQEEELNPFFKIMSILIPTIFITVKIFEIKEQRREIIEGLHEQVDALFPLDKIEETFKPVREHTDEFIGFFRKTFLDELLNPIIKDIESIQAKTIDREKEKEKIEKALLSLKEKKELIEKQLQEVEQYKKTLDL